jgi:hypothetical protein
MGSREGGREDGAGGRTGRQAHQLLAAVLQRRHLLGAGKVLQHHESCSRPNPKQQTRPRSSLVAATSRRRRRPWRRPPAPTPTPTHHRVGTDPAAPGSPSCVYRDVLGCQPPLPATKPALSAEGLSPRGLWCFLWGLLHTRVSIPRPGNRAMPFRRPQSANQALPQWLPQESRHLEGSTRALPS